MDSVSLHKIRNLARQLGLEKVAETETVQHQRSRRCVQLAGAPSSWSSSVVHLSSLEQLILVFTPQF